MKINDNYGLTKVALTGKTLKEGTEYLKNYYNLNQSVDELIEIRRNLFLNSVKTGITLYPGFIEFHRNLQNLKMKTCIATSLEKKIFDTLKVSNFLYELFDKNIFFCSEHVKNSKPAPDIFIYAANKMKTNVNECIVLEDSPNGIQAAKSALIGKTIALCHTFQRKDLIIADYVFNSFDEIDLKSLQ